ncbi:PiggyBac transposable element-derived protein 4 [Araneus ventricosus]|uniref:PiggyBac transposable element-derived protein 4 n=1 Tax=Araneus ventricosus TaxID=182803 RepID=A0A4Y2KY57_ARAVE|nr:PiggyBac transposable element-derived protein 4 [Araneus ventricosus]
MRNFHFVNNENFDPSTHPCTKLWKIYDVIEHIRKKFCEIVSPEEQLTVDESLMLYKGRLSWKQYIPLKRSRFGIKFFMLCEAFSGYICDFLLYTGKGISLLPEYSSYPQSTAVVLHLLHRFLNRGFCVTVDNYYMSPSLADILVQKKTDIYGTLCSNRKDLPPGFAKEKVENGQCIAYQRGKVMVLRGKWKDKKIVNMRSIFHATSSVSVHSGTTKETLKPKVIYDYNFTMSGVDRCDQEMSYYPSTRK